MGARGRESHYRPASRYARSPTRKDESPLRFPSLRQPPARWAGRSAFLAYLGHCADRHGNGVCMWVGRGVGVLGVGGMGVGEAGI